MYTLPGFEGPFNVIHSLVVIVLDVPHWHEPGPDHGDMEE